MADSTRPVVWSIAGSDSGAGAGIQADLRAFDAFDVHGCTALAAITAQNSVRVDRVEPISTQLLSAQLASLATDLVPHAVKTGVLGSLENVRCVAEWLDRLRSNQRVALVVDPVWRASTGTALSSEELRQALLHELIPRATIITPNRTEAAWLLGWDEKTMSDGAVVQRAAIALRSLGPQAVVITGGDAGGPRSLDWMDSPEASGWLALPRVLSRDHHGSGCVFASSIAAALALEFCTADATVLAKMSATQSIRRGWGAGSGAGAARPERGFALLPELLPSLHAVHDFEAPAFAALDERQLGLYAVVDSADWVDKVLAAGVRTVQLRIKDAGRVDLSLEIARSVEAARAVQAQLFVNDHWQLAIEHRAYGVHLGQEDLVKADLDRLRRAGLRLGLSTHSYWEVCQAHSYGPSYIACGPIYPTTTKNMPWRPQGLGNLAYWCEALREPVVAIAGMDPTRTHDAARCGAAGVAVLRGIVQATDPKHAITHLQSAFATGALAARLPHPNLPRSTYCPT